MSHEPLRDPARAPARPASQVVPRDRLRPSVAGPAGPGFGLLPLQRLAGNRAVTNLLAGALQRKLTVEGGKQNTITVSGAAKAQAKFVTDKSLHTAAIAAGTKVGKYTFTAVAGASPGTLGYEKYKGKTFCGGRTYGNLDGQLPGSTTYTEWDTAQYVAGGRGVERVVVGANGKAYFTNDHYANFCEIRG
jgi:guanyl-specific ribonuclease Sa